MQELLNNAWVGWQNYKEVGKYGALLLLVLCFLWFRREECKEKLLLVYTTLVTLCCIFPVSAAVLMKYQTPFYDYIWIWNYVPFTLMVAYGGVIFLYAQWERQEGNSNSRGSRKKWQDGVLLCAVVLLMMLCGRMGQPLPDNSSTEDYERAQRVLAALTENVPDAANLEAGGEEICLWAPKEIMSVAGSVNPHVKLLYGRNMWDAKLGAYFYEGYGGTEERLYLWMCNAEENGTLTYALKEERGLDVTACMEEAKAVGVNRILLPGTIEKEEIQMLSRTLQSEIKELEGYYLFEI